MSDNQQRACHQIAIRIDDDLNVSVEPVYWSTYTERRPGRGKQCRDFFPNKYTVIDLETTGLSPEYDEIIELAAVKVKDGQIVDRFQQLVKPENGISDFIAELTGITNEMVADAPSIAEALLAYLDFIGNDIVIGHNVTFDINFIYDNAARWLDRIFGNYYINTLSIARKLIPGLAHYRLDDLRDYYGVSHESAHRALSDCEHTNEIYQHMFKVIDAMPREEYFNFWQRKSSKRYWHQKLDPKTIHSTVVPEDMDKDHPLYGKKIVFTGALEIPRKEAMQMVANVGGVNASGVTKATDYLVLGCNDYCPTIKDGKSSKQKRAEELILKGEGISIIDEKTFFDLLCQGDD